MPLHETWMYAETAYHLHPFLEDFEFLTYPFLGAIGSLPSWFLMAYFFVAYLGIVRRKEWPHFFRFHVVMGMLLEIALQVIGTVSRWMPLAIYWGKFGMHFWTAVAFAYLFTILECIRCALAVEHLSHFSDDNRAKAVPVLVIISVILITLSDNNDPFLINITVIDDFASDVAIFNVRIVLFRLFACNLMAPWCRISPMLVQLSRFFDFFKPNRAIVLL
ncbi:hypothetical protein Goari_027078 [Gossypium aridum]|uniref:Protein TIC 20 n=1 Tax=Gossypium aridum TaxID=34290 RepID=A0A7J8YSY3_GOSAI|nr:hypothetical protein [Gossypium aridum]